MMVIGLVVYCGSIFLILSDLFCCGYDFIGLNCFVDKWAKYCVVGVWWCGSEWWWYVDGRTDIRDIIIVYIWPDYMYAVCSMQCTDTYMHIYALFVYIYVLFVFSWVFKSACFYMDYTNCITTLVQ